MAGRPRKPLNLHLLEGTHRADRHGPVPQRTPSGPEGRPTKPQDLTPDAARFWDDICEERADANIAKRIDGPALRLMADLWGKLQTVSRLADADPTDVAARRSMVAYSSEFAKLAGKFGLTPDARQRLQGAIPETPRPGIAARRRETTEELEARYFGD